MPDPLQLWLASTSAGKLREFRQAGLLRGVGVELLPGIRQLTPCVEDGRTFEENACKKAIYYSRAAEGLVFTDDSGLCVDAMGGAPGVFSARFAGSTASDSANNEKLLEELRRVAGSESKSGEANASDGSHFPPRAPAHYTCVIALAERGRILKVTSGRADGVVLEQASGSGGFGYDPYFFYPPLGATFAELSPEAKFAVSHRGEAFLKLLDFLETAPDSMPAAEAGAATSGSSAQRRRA